MKHKRKQQMGKLIQKDLSEILQKEGFNIFGKALVTITNINLTPDFSISRVYLSIYNAEDKNSVLSAINEHKHEIRKLLGIKIKNQVRKIPQLEFYQDETLDYVYKMEELFKDLKNPSSDKS